MVKQNVACSGRVKLAGACLLDVFEIPYQLEEIAMYKKSRINGVCGRLRMIATIMGDGGAWYHQGVGTGGWV